MTEIIDNEKLTPDYETIEPLKPDTNHVYDETFMEDVIWQFYEQGFISNYNLPKYKRFIRQNKFESDNFSDLIFQLDKAFIIVEIQQNRLDQEHINRAHTYATYLSKEQGSDDVKVLYVSNTIKDQQIKRIEKLGHEHFIMDKEFFIKRAKDNVEGLELVIIDKPLKEIEERPPKTVFLKTLDMLRERKGLSLKQLSQIYNEKFKKKLHIESLNRISNGKQTPSVEQLMNFAELFEVHVDVLLSEKNYIKVIGYSNNYIVENDLIKREPKIYVPFNEWRGSYANNFCIVNDGDDQLTGKYIIFRNIVYTKEMLMKHDYKTSLCFFESSSSDSFLGTILRFNEDDSLKIMKGQINNPKNIIDNYSCDNIYVFDRIKSDGDLLTINEYSDFIEGK